MPDSIVVLPRGATAHTAQAASWANPITWHVDVLRYATIGIGQPSIVWLEAGAFLMFTAAAFGGALWALKRQ